MRADEPVYTCRCCRMRGTRSGHYLIAQGRIVCTCLPNPICALCMQCSRHCPCPYPALYGRLDMAVDRHLTFLFDEIAAERMGAVLEVSR